MEWIDFLIGAIPGVLVAITFALKFAKYVKKFTQEKNWTKLINLVMHLIAEAEDLHDNGVDRKTWVIEMTIAGAEAIGYEIDVDKLSELIDSLCAMSKKVNVKEK